MLSALQEELVQRYGEAQRARIARGLKQVASLWRPADGDLAAFVREHFVATEEDRSALLQRLEGAMEQIDGHMTEIARELRRPMDTDVGRLLPVDSLLAAFDPSAHLTEDLFRGKIAFVALLNFPLTTLAERLQQGRSYSRQQWAEVRLTGRFARRVPAEVQQRIAEVMAANGLYIAEYNIWMHHLLTEQGERLWPKGVRLISHWNLRDDLKAAYAEPNGLRKQRIIARIMDRIVTQTIPQVVINNPRVDWEPFSNAVRPAPPAEIEEGAPPSGVDLGQAQREPDTRYARLLANFHAQRAADPYSPSMPTLIARSFELGREMPEERVVELLSQVCASPLAKQVAALIQKRLGRPLEPHDLWYGGFQVRGRWSEQELDAITRKRYPSAAAFQKDLPRILMRLGFSRERARFLAERIVVDPARGAGHAMEARRRGDFPRLRTRIGRQGMDYKGYNIALHELGHNVEQVFSLYGVDHTLLQGVPNTAFTEAIAFVFQGRDLEVLGLARPEAAAEPMRVLNDFWMTWEIAGVGLVDIAVWHWMYDHPDATPEALRQEVVRIARQVWNRYYAPVLGTPDATLLAIYSHMIQETLYLPDYPLGHLIAFQIEEHLRKKGGPLGPEIERMTTLGAVLPDLWMEHATGAPVSAAPLLRATEAALAALADK
ncbi:MAG: hypothetical protein RMK29_10970 [Myxococcales bacterium]|nr:hypothetical protein [Myxococcota bacterium]MDW8282227.1 hypothetical protein [Myxococcales bacterium]